MALPTIHVDSQLNVSVAHAKGVAHQYYEDRYGMFTRDQVAVKQGRRGELFAVFDGIGSAPKGRHAAVFMAEALRRFYAVPSEVPATAEGLAGLLARANQEIHGWGTSPGSGLPLGGCAGTVIWVARNHLYLFHAGDTSGILIRDGRSGAFTHSHQTEAGALFRFFGIGASFKMQMSVFEVESGDRILLVSDGVTKHLPPTAAANRCGQFSERHLAAHGLVRDCQRAGVADDITAMVIDFVPLEK